MIRRKEEPPWIRSRAKCRDFVLPEVIPTSPPPKSPANKRSVALARSLSSALYEHGQKSFQDALSRTRTVSLNATDYDHGPTKDGSPLYTSPPVPRTQRAVSVPARVSNRRLQNANEEYRVEFLDTVSSSFPGVVLVSIVPEVAEEPEVEVADDSHEGDEGKEPEPPRKTHKRKSGRKGRHWVDELTVSSDPPPASNTRLTPSERRKQQQQQQQAADDVIEQQVVIETAEEPEPTLPGYACPSSEDKSREFAIRNWLNNTCFSVSMKTVPLV